MRIRFIVAALLACAALQAHAFSASAVIKPHMQAVISSEIAAKITTFPYYAGDSFAKDAVLVKFDCGVFQSQLDKVSADMEAAKIKYQNNLELEKMNSIGAAETQLSALDVKKSEAEYSVAKTAVDRCVIRAPFSGMVTRKMVNQYESVKQQEELLEIVNTDVLEAVAIMPSTYVNRVRMNQSVNVHIDELRANVAGRVIAVIPAADPVSQTIQVRVKFANPRHRVYPGMSGSVSFGN